MILLAVILTLSTPVDCDAVRAQVAQHGKVKAVAWARSQGYSWADILRIRRECRV